MQVSILSNGIRDMRFRPYIEHEESSKSVSLADLNGPGFHHGLYDSHQHPFCTTWLDHFNQHPSRNNPVSTFNPSLYSQPRFKNYF